MKSKLSNIVTLIVFLVNSLTVGAVGDGASGRALSAWTFTDDPVKNRAMMAGLYRSNGLISEARSGLYKEVLSNRNVSAEFLPSGTYLTDKKNDLDLIRACFSADIRILLEREKEKRRGLFEAVRTKVLSDERLISWNEMLGGANATIEDMDFWRDDEKDKLAIEIMAKAIEISILADKKMADPFTELLPEEREIAAAFMAIITDSREKRKYDRFVRDVIRLEKRAGYLKRLKYGVSSDKYPDMETRFRKESLKYGGKGAWSKVLEECAEELGYRTPKTVYLKVAEVWAKFVKANEPAIKIINQKIVDDESRHGQVSKSTLDEAEWALEHLAFPEDLGASVENLSEFILAAVKELDGELIVRSSGVWEDSYFRNMAGVFTSPMVKNARAAAEGVKKIFHHAIGKMWLHQNDPGKKVIEGLPNIVTPEEGLGMVVQKLVDFRASGTARTNRFGKSVIQAAFGEAEYAVRSVNANTCQFVFDKEKSPDGENYEFNPSYLRTPYEVRIKIDGKVKELTAAQGIYEMNQALKDFPEVNGEKSPISIEKARKLYAVINALEEKVGYPLDIEWGFEGDELYIIQMRPAMGDDHAKKLIDPAPELSEDKRIAVTPTAVGQTAREGYKSRVVVFADGTRTETVRKFEESFFGNGPEEKGYILVKSDAASCADQLGQTRARVLVDPRQGSEQAHNINYIENRIRDGEFVYCNGPALKNGFLKNLTLYPHPDFPGVWVSAEEVTYFSGGLKGEFYAEKHGDVKLPSPFERDADEEYLKTFYSILKENSLRGQMEFTSAGNALRTILRECGLAVFEDKLSIFRPENDTAERRELLRPVIGMLNTFYDRGGSPSVEWYLRLIRALRSALDVPILPDRWEWYDIGRLLDLTAFVPDHEAIMRIEKENRTTVETDGIFKVMVFECHAGRYRDFIEKTRGIPGCTLRSETGETSYMQFQRMLEANGYYADLVVIHLGDANMVGWLSDQVEALRKSNPDVEILVEYGLRRPDVMGMQQE
ncbi:MAG: hypothetical protein HQL30_11105, partial [Candidatus Omnitrophica bacterium]|nr:hypothetical protein [Candidatus Omnitrophota bacterium]